MAKVNYEKLWKDYKEFKMQEYIEIQNYEHGPISFQVIRKLAKDLSKMDRLDRTNDFNNLLYDLQEINKGRE